LITSKFILIIVVLSIGASCFSQSRIDSVMGKIDPQKWSATIERKVEKIQDKLIAKSQKTLGKLQKQEEKVYRKMLRGKDSLQARMALADIKNKYKTLEDKINDTSLANKVTLYIPKLDTLSTALKFLDQQGVTGRVKEALTKTQSLQNKFQQAEEIKKFIRERKQQVKEQMEKLGLTKQLKGFNKEAYYYSAAINEYKGLLKNSKKAERKALQWLSKTKLFKDFMRRNSMLASLFRMSGDPDDPFNVTGVAGLQTRAQVNNLIQQQVAAGGPDAQQQFRQNLQDAQSQLNQLKNKINQSGGRSGGDMMPDGFKPNHQKTKTFFQRLEYGTNVQTQKASNFFPVISDIGLSVGYKLSDKSIVGIGASYKMGLGRGWNNIHFSSEGIGLRSFIDWKIKGSFWVSGGYERNYRPDAEVSGSNPPWGTGVQQSGLIGFSKVISLKTKFFKKTSLKLLWDFLSYDQAPRTQPIVFRVGYNF
jgi:hypothetical protein